MEGTKEHMKEHIMMQTGLFDCQQRFEQLDKASDPLVQLNTIIDWEAFRPSLKTLRQKERKSPAGRKPYDVEYEPKLKIEERQVS